MLIRWQKTIVDQRGNVQPGAVLTIRRMSDQAIVTVYRDREGTQPYPTGTVTADENGYAYFYASPGLYRITSIQPAIDWPDESLAATFVTVGGGPYQNVAEGISSTSDGEYFFVSPSSQPGGLYDLYLNDGGDAQLLGSAPSLEAINELDSLVVNRGKIYPLNAAVRDGIVSPAAGGIGIPYWNNAVLRVHVVGAPDQVAGKYFRLAALDNGFSGRSGVQIEEFDAATYSTASAATVIQQRTDGNFNYGAALGITSFVVEPATRPGLRIEITIDGAGLPPAGTPMVATTSGTPAWSWIVDPSCVEINEAMAYDTLRANYYKPFPLRAENRAGVISPPNAAFNATLLSIKIDGAEKGRFYRPEYFVNEDTALVGADPFGWVLASYDAATFSVSDNAGRILLHNYTDPAPAIDRTKGIQTVVITCANDPSLTFTITLDAHTLPPAGTAIRSLTPAQANGRSWVVDPSQYVLRQQAVVPTANSGSLAIEASASDILVGFASQADCYQLAFGPNGANSLPNIKAVNRASGVDLDSASWNQVSASTTDWLPPLLFQKADIPPRSGLWFTGGNHLIDGYPTAENILYQVLIDGAPLSAFEGRGRRVDIKIVNRLMAANTVVAPGSVTDANYVALQKFWLRFYESGAVFIQCRVQALQDLLFQRDYGPQVVGTGFNDTVMIAAGQQGGRVAWANGLNSGPSSSYPKANALTLRSAANGQLASWIDRDFGSVNRTIDPAEPLVRAAPTSGDKMYQLAFLDTAGIPMAAGEFYEWQGGYFLSSARAGANGIDSTIDYGDGFQSIFNNASYV